MEPKDLKNSKVELSGALVEPEIANDQDVAEVAEAEVTVEETVAEPVEMVVPGVEDSVVVEEVAEMDEQAVEAEVEETAVEEVAEVDEKAVEAVVEETVVEEVAEVDEKAVEAEIEEVAEVEVAEPAAELVEEPVIPLVEELQETIADVDLELHEDDILDENNPKVVSADYSSLTEVELIESLRQLLESDNYDSIRDDVDAIKIHFFRLYRANIEAQKAAYAEAGGDLAEFKAEPDPNELELRNLLKQYQDVRSEHNRKADEAKETNLQKKYEIIEEIKSLINNKESINKTFHEFRELQNRWLSGKSVECCLIYPI